MITLWYWLGAATLGIHHSGRLAIYAVIAHSLPFSLIVIDNIFNMIRFKLLHFLWFQPIYIAYGIANWLYVKLNLGPKPIYPYITWDNWTTYTVLVGSELTSFIAFVIGYFIAEYKFKKRKEALSLALMATTKLETNSISVKIED